MQTPLLKPAYAAVLFDMDNTLFDFIEAMKQGTATAAEVIGAGTGDQLLSYTSEENATSKTTPTSRTS